MDPRSPYVLSTHDLGRSPGTMSEVERTIPAPDDLATGVMRVIAGSELVLTARLESVREGILVTGVVRADTHAECVRCLRDIDSELVVDVADLYFYPGAREAALAEGDEEAEDMRELEGELLDLEPLLRDSIVTAMPFQPLCRPDCAGLCPGCGERFDDLPADHEHVDIDPRWAALAGLAEGASTDLAEDGPSGSEEDEAATDGQDR
ncbi:YceD family protein [Georgenia sp. MJ170]|uniref:YceD family protein n=1 Tax=Georgenia sunbinii TaxID=3117728 RepID=UPI002F2610F0